MIGVPLLLAAASSSCPAQTSSTAPSVERAQVMGAVGFGLLVADELEPALECLRDAAALDSTSPILARDHASAALAAGRLDEAKAAVLRARELGDDDPDVHRLHATILARLGERREAIRVGAEAPTWESDLLGVVLADRAAVDRTIPLVEEETKRGTLASLVLASHEAAQGSLRSATRLASLARAHAQNVQSPGLLSASRELFNAIQDRSHPTLDLRLRSTFEHATNPSYLARGRELRTAGLRLAVDAGGVLSVPIGDLTTEFGANFTQHIFVTQRDILSEYDVSGIALSAAMRYPLSAHPTQAVLGVSARFVDLFGDRFRTHFSTSIEGGPDLTLELSAGIRLRLGLYGSATDIIDTSPADAIVSSLNRDRVGQRATVTLFGEFDRIAAVASAAFLHDDALGDAFDAVGGALAGRLYAFPTRDLALHTGVGLTIREFGPVGDKSIIGPAATRTQLRIVAELGARVELWPSVDLVIEDTWISNQARDGHEYVENVLRMGAEVSW